MIKRTLAAVGLAGVVGLLLLGPRRAVGRTCATTTCIEQESCGGADLALTTRTVAPCRCASPPSSLIAVYQQAAFGYNNEPVG